MVCKHCNLRIEYVANNWEHYDATRNKTSWVGCSYARKNIGGEKITPKGGGPYAEPPTKELNINRLLNKIDEL